MSINYPTSLDSFTTVAGTDKVSASLGGRTHSTFHSDADSAIVALETKLGIGSSTPTSGFFLVGTGSGTSAWTKAVPSGTVVGDTDTQTLTNKTIGNTNTVTLKDTLFTLQDDGDTTKQAQFQLSGITTATTRTLTIPDANLTIVGTDTTQTLTNKTFNATNNTLSNITTAMFATNVVDTDGTLAANSDTRLASQKATKTYVDAKTGAPTFIDSFTTPVNGNHTSEQTVWSKSITANTFGTTNAISGKIYCSAFNAGATTTILTIKLKYGATTIATITTGSLTTTAAFAVIEFSIIAAGATNSQKGWITALTNIELSNVSFYSASGTAAEDSTASKTMSVTVTANNSNDSFTADMGTIFIN